jgi:chromosome segregation ATPase
VQNNSVDNPRNGHGAVIGILFAGLVVALAGDLYLWNQSREINRNLGDTKDAVASQISKLGDATTTLLEQRMQSIDREMKDAQDSTATAIKKARSEAQKTGKDLSAKLQDEQEEVSDKLQQVASAADSKFTQVSSDVSNVKTDVTGVKDDVDGVKKTAATTQAQLEQTGSDLKRAMGDMGTMSGLIATNSKDLQSLRQLGERNYIEFDLTKAQRQKKIGNLTITLTKADPKRSRYTVTVLADDKTTEKKDRTINEPVQLYVSGSRQPDEIVVNQVKKDEVIGYLATPKVVTAQR